MWTILAPIWFEHVIVLGHKCSDVGCDRVARWTCFWPGQTRAKCTEHRDAWARVAQHMGFDLHSVALAAVEWPEPDASSVRFSLLELS